MQLWRTSEDYGSDFSLNCVVNSLWSDSIKTVAKADIFQWDTGQL